MPGATSTAGVAKLPEQIHERVGELTRPMSLSQERYNKFIDSLALELEKIKDRGADPIRRFQMACESWTRYKDSGKHENYFLGILRNLEEKAVAESKTLDGLPPMIT